MKKYLCVGEAQLASAHVAALIVLQECASDLDGDGLINVNDLLGMLSQFGADGAIPEDVNGDNIVNVRRPKRLLACPRSPSWYTAMPLLLAG